MALNEINPLQTNKTWTIFYHKIFEEAYNQKFKTKFHLSSFLLICLASLMIISPIINIVRKFANKKFKLPRASKVPQFFKVPKKSLPFFGVLLELLWNRNELPAFLRKWTLKYGSAIRTKIFGKDFVFLNDPAMIQAVLSSSNSGHLNKPDFIYKVAFTDALSDGLVAADPDHWKIHRTTLTKAFTYEALKRYLLVICQHSHKLISELEPYTKPIETFEQSLVTKLHLSTFGIISHIVTGTDMVSNNECSKFYENFHRGQEIATYRLYRPWLLVQPIFNIHPIKKELENCIKSLDDGIKMLLEKQKKLNTFQQNFDEIPFKSVMDVMMAAEMPDEEIMVEMTTFLLAGHDTLSVTLTFLLANLALHPEHQNACRKEIDEMFDILSLNEESATTTLSIECLNDLKYLDRCIKESLRMYPSIPFILRELNSPVKLDKDNELGSGVIVMISAWTLHRNPELYPNPDKFNPDRFLPENSKGRSKYAYIPFSAGPRNCIGWKLATLEMKILVSYILRHFKVHIANKEEDVQRIRFHIVLSTEEKIELFLKKRQE